MLLAQRTTALAATVAAITRDWSFLFELRPWAFVAPPFSGGSLMLKQTPG